MADFQPSDLIMPFLYYGSRCANDMRGMHMKVATWNINLRFGCGCRCLRNSSEAHAPDVLCLQETKVINDLFPAEGLKQLGYVHQAINGQKGYHGVAIVR